MAELDDLSTTDASNTGRFPENMQFRNVNDSGRALEGMIAREYKDRNMSLIASGSSNAYAVSSNRTISAYAAGLTIGFTANHTTTGAATLNVSGLGARSIVAQNGSALTAGDIVNGQKVLVVYRTGTDDFQMVGGRVTATSSDVLARITPVGMAAPWPGATAPTGWLLAYGQAVSRTTYSELFAAYGTTYGAGDGSTTFNLPDYRGRTPFGRDDMGGSAASRVTTAGSSTDGATLGAVGGAQNVSLTAAQGPQHSHTATVIDPTHTHAQTVTTVEPGVTGALTGGGVTAYAWDGNQNTGFAATGISVSIANSGSGSAHSNMPPAIIQNWIILALPALAAATTTGVNGLLYQFSTSTSGSPGAGRIAFDDVTPSSAAGFRISETDATGAPMGPVIATWDDSTSTIKGTLYVYKVASLSTYAVFQLTGTITDSGAYDEFDATYVSNNGTFADGDQLCVIYVPRGDKGDTGSGNDGSDGGFRYAFETSTTMGEPAAGGLRLNNATLGAVTAIAVANTTADAGNPSVAGWINTWDDSTTTAHRGTLYIRGAAGAGNQVVLDVTSAVTDNSTWLTATVAVVSSAGSFSAADELLVSFSRTGDKGLDGAGSGTVTGVTAGAGMSASGVGSTGGTVTVSGTLTAVEAVNAQTGTSYTLLAGDHTKLVTLSNASSVAVTVPQATGSFGAGFWTDIVNLNAGVVTLTPTTSTINGAASYVLGRFQSGRLVSDGTNWQVMQGSGLRGQTVTVASATTCDIGAVASHRVAISGTTTITSFGTVPNQLRFGSFSGVLTLTHNATTLILPGAASITTAAGDTFIASSDASGNWTVIVYQKASGAAIVGGSGGGAPSAPQGRLTLTTATPVMASTTSGQTTVYYAPYAGRYVPLYDGSSYTMTDIGGELSQATTDSTKSPAAVTTNTNYDLFVWNDGGTYRCTRGPAWSSGTARGTGAGTTELERVAGFLLNKVSITNGPAANRGTYVGTIRTNGSSQVDFIVPTAPAAGGTAGVIGVWNAYNRVDWSALNAESANSWSYTTGTVRQVNASAGMQTAFVSGLAEGIVFAEYVCWSTGGGTNGRIGIGYDSTSVFSGTTGAAVGQSSTINGVAAYRRPVEIGWHTVAALEYGAASLVYYGDNNVPLEIQSGMYVSGSY